MNEEGCAGARGPRREKLDSTLAGVNLVWTVEFDRARQPRCASATRGLAAMGLRRVTLVMAALGLALTAACGRPLRSIPPETSLLVNWPTLLGDVTRAGLASETVATDAEQIWQVDIGRGIVAPPLVDGPVVFVTTANRMVAAVSSTSGEHYWERRLDGPLLAGAVLRDDRLYTVTSDQQGRVYALNVRRGSRIWSRNTAAASYPPLLVGDALYLATDGGHVIALDARDGEELWQAKLPGAATATPTPFREGLVVTARDTIFFLSRLGGEIQHRAALGAVPGAAPALRGDTLFVPLQSAELVAYRLPALEEIWRIRPSDQPILAAPVAAPDGSVYLLNRAAEVWRVPPGQHSAERLASLSGAAYASLALVREGLLVGRLDGALFLLRHDGSIVWRKDFDDSIRAPVTVQNGAVYVPLAGGKIVKLR